MIKNSQTVYIHLIQKYLHDYIQKVFSVVIAAIC